MVWVIAREGNPGSGLVDLILSNNRQTFHCEHHVDQTMGKAL